MTCFCSALIRLNSSVWKIWAAQSSTFLCSSSLRCPMVRDAQIRPKRWWNA